MRITLLIAPLCAALAALASRPAAATSCSGPPWDPYDEDGSGTYSSGRKFPVDVVWWEMHSCAFGIDRPSGCTLTRPGVTIPVDVEVVGGEGCSAGYDGHEGDNDPDVILHYVPTQPLAPDTTYTLDCEGSGVSYGPRDVVVTTRASAEPAAPPGSLADAGVQAVRGNDGCCSIGDYIELSVDTEATSLQEGGYIEAKYANGQVLALTRQDEPGMLLLPDTRKALELTPVAADGTRGETVRFEAGEIPRELVYIPCTVTERPPPLALWLLAPLVWIGAHGRRRRAAAHAVGGAP